MDFILLALIIIASEAFLILTVRSFWREFQWLITEADECPKLDSEGLKKFFRHGFDPHLGWVRKPNTSGVEKGRKGEVRFTIDSKGARSNRLADGLEQIIATFGDSYVFCRQVGDDDTWQASLTRKLGAGVLNYGVGNYGVDQALLRYERTELPASVRIAVLGFVPETICRVQSYWKHYLEFGNTFAFKPRFALEGRGLILIPSAMQSEEDFSRLREKLQHIQKVDGFYKTKFRSLQFRFPYIVSFLRHPKRNMELLDSLFDRELARKFKTASPEIENAPFRHVMEFNIKQAHKMYSRAGARELLKAILMRFKEEALKRGHKPVVMVMPQLIDLKIIRGGKAPYHDFFESLCGEMAVIDLTELFRSHKVESLYTEDLYGGHFSKEGNEIISAYLSDKLGEI